MMRSFAYATTALVLASLLGTAACKKKIVSQDEEPIIVQNGSMTIDNNDAAAEWQDDTGGWKNVTGKDHKGELWVRVDLVGGTTCKGSGHPVHVEYSDGGFKAIFNFAGNPPYTKVEPKGQLDMLTKHRLGHGKSGDGGYINGVKINGADIPMTGTTAPCLITKENLIAVNVCSSLDKCQ